MTEKILHIMEPTLSNGAGHCRSFIGSLCGAGDGGWAICIWAGRGARLPELSGPGVRVVPHFRRRLRRLQLFFLFRKLLGRPGRLFVATAGRTDVVLLDLAAKGAVPRGKVYMYFHWLRPTSGKADCFRKAARRHPHLGILAPTASVVDAFREWGFADAKLVPYPILPLPESSGADFRHLLVAGAARQDKGIDAVAGLVGHLASLGLSLPVALQASPDHYERHDLPTKAALARLRAAGYPHLRLYPETLDDASYAALFPGAICLQPYRQADFADRISGVTLDALSAGSPVVAATGTWTARVVERFDAGIAVDDFSPASMLRAVSAISADYGRYRARALEAGRALREENNPRHLYEALTGPCGGGA